MAHLIENEAGFCIIWETDVKLSLLDRFSYFQVCFRRALVVVDLQNSGGGLIKHSLLLLLLQMMVKWRILKRTRNLYGRKTSKDQFKLLPNGLEPHVTYGFKLLANGYKPIKILLNLSSSIVENSIEHSLCSPFTIANPPLIFKGKSLKWY